MLTSSLAASYGPPPGMAGMLSRSQVRPSWMDYYSSRPGYGLTPERIWSVLRAAELGQPADQVYLFEDVIESDGHLRGQVEQRIGMVSGKQWVIKPGGPDEIDRLVARELELRLSTVNMQEFIEHQLLGILYGYAGSEVLWRRERDWIVPAHFVNVPLPRIVFGTDNTPRLSTEQNVFPGEDLVGAWAFTYGRHRQCVRAGLLRTAVWWALFKRLSVRDWIVFAEKFGIPIVMGVYEENSGPESRRALEQAVIDIGEAGQAVLSDATRIQFGDGGVTMRNGNNASLHPSVVALCNAEISKLLTGGTLNVETTGQASYAVGRVHQDRGFAISLYDARLIGITFQRNVGIQFVRHNGLEGVAKPPRLHIQLLPDSDLLTRVKVASTLANELGMELDADQLYEETGYRPPSSPASAVRGTKMASKEPGEDGPPVRE